jgi:hypothetical protein
MEFIAFNLIIKHFGAKRIFFIINASINSQATWNRSFLTLFNNVFSFITVELGGRLWIMGSETCRRERRWPAVSAFASLTSAKPRKSSFRMTGLWA